MRILIACLFFLSISACSIPPAFTYDTDELQAALAAGADPNQRSLGSWPLMWNMSAASRDYDPHKPHRHKKDPKQITANVRLLLEAGADPDQPEKFPPLYHALRYCWPEMVQMLVEAGADPHGRAFGDTNMVIAVTHSYCPTVDEQYQVTMQLLDYVEEREGRDAMLAYVSRATDNYSLLHIAAWKELYGVLAALIEKRVDLDPQVKKVPYLQQTALEMYCAGCTPLHIAEGVGHTRIAEALRRAGARDDIRNDVGATPVEFRGRFLPGDSWAEKAKAAGEIWSKTVSGDLVGLSLMNANKSLELEIYERATRIDKPEKFRLYGGPVPPPEGWRGLEDAVAKAKRAGKK